jgi:hypothetical protein
VTSQRVGWLLDGLADTLQDNVSALAPGPEVSQAQLLSSSLCDPCCTSQPWRMCRLHLNRLSCQMSS